MGSDGNRIFVHIRFYTLQKNVNTRFAWWNFPLAFLVLAWSLGMLWVCGPVMRETDQAALLDGAVRIARGATEGPFHNYSGQFGSFWALAWSQKCFEIVSLREYVAWGNLVACSWFCFSLLLFSLGLVSICRQTSAGRRGLESRFLLLLVTLTTPCVVLSVPLLSSNVLSGGMILALLASSLLWRKWWGIALGSVCVFCAVCLRQDAAFLLPLICFVPQSKLRLWDLPRERYFWCFLVAAILAILLGRHLSPIRYFPTLVLNWKLIGCYTFFGLLGGGCIFLWGLLHSWRSSNPVFTKLAMTGIICLPILMYSILLYSPRHLFMAGLVPLVLAISKWGHDWPGDQEADEFGLGSSDVPGSTPSSKPKKVGSWAHQRAGFHRGLLWVGLGINVAWLVFAPVIKKDQTVSIGLTHATCYPTADGLWPMGGGFDFLSRLKTADREYEAIDHNQEVWGAWEAWEPKSVLPDAGFESESNLGAYAFLWSAYYQNSSAMNPSRPKVAVETDREWIGVANRSVKTLRASYAGTAKFYQKENLAHSGRSRLLFMSPLLEVGTVDLELYEVRNQLRQEFPKKEFLSVKQKRDDGHLYVERDGMLFKSNYPEIFLRFF